MQFASVQKLPLHLLTRLQPDGGGQGNRKIVIEFTRLTLGRIAAMSIAAAEFVMVGSWRLSSSAYALTICAGHAFADLQQSFDLIEITTGCCQTMNSLH